MPRVTWGVGANEVDKFDRESQYKPYAGPIPQNGVYRFKLKKFQYIAATREKGVQLRVGLELVPRNKTERKYAGYFIMDFVPVAERTAFRYVPYLDALGVTGREFERGTIADEEGNIKKIGKWRNDGETEILAQLADDADQNGNPRKKIGWVGENAELDDEEEAEDDEEDFDDEEDEDGYDEDGYDEDGYDDDDEEDF